MEDFKKIERTYKGPSQRIDLYLKSLLPYYSRQLIKEIIENGNVKVNNKNVKPSYKLKDGDIIFGEFSKSEVSNVNFYDFVLYEDNDIIVLNKPAGLLVHPTGESWINDYTALSFSKNTLTWLIYSQTEIPNSDVERLGLVHRLDAETSGIMLIAKNRYSQKFVMEQFSSRMIEKNYKAVVSGVIKDNKLVIDAPIGRLTGQKKLKVMEYGRDAVTEISVIKRGRSNTFIDVYPKTGRTNQIRVHLSYITHPIIGDYIYGGIEYFRLMLHSYSIKFVHPSTKKEVFFKAELDDDFMKYTNELIKR